MGLDDENRLLEIAYHESGHAVAMYLHKRPILSLYIPIPSSDAADRERLGGVEDALPDVDTIITMAERNPGTKLDSTEIPEIVLIKFAGSAAQARYTRKSFAHCFFTRNSDGEPHEGSDFGEIEKLRTSSPWAHTDDLRQLIISKHDQACAIINNPVCWHAIEKLASEILRIRTLDGGTATRIIIDAIAEWEDDAPELHTLTEESGTRGSLPRGRE